MIQFDFVRLKKNQGVIEGLDPPIEIKITFVIIPRTTEKKVSNWKKVKSSIFARCVGRFIKKC